MYIQQFIDDKEELIVTALNRPGTTQKQLAKLPHEAQMDLCTKAIAREVEHRVIQKVQADWFEKINDMWNMYVLSNGDRDDVDVAQLGDYDTGVDDAFEALVEDIQDMLSKDWLGQYTIDTHLHEDGEILKLSQNVGKEVYKTLTYGKTPAQILSNAGIVVGDIEAGLAAHMQPQTQEEKAQSMEDSQNTAQEIAQKAQLTLGANFDLIAVYEDVELLFDSDAILANAAAARLGLDERDVENLQMASLDGMDKEQFFQLLQEEPPKADKPKRGGSGKKSEPKEPKEPKTGENLTPSGKPGDVDARVLALLKDHGGTKDTDMSAKLGVSRGSYNNWINGKNAFAPDDTQRDTLRSQIVEHINGLHEALAILEGNDNPEVIF